MLDNMFQGSNYDPALDGERLAKQLDRVYRIIKDGKKRSLQRIQTDIYGEYGIKDPESSISAQLRHLKKKQFGCHTIKKERAKTKTHGTWLYWLEKKDDDRKN